MRTLFAAVMLSLLASCVAIADPVPSPDGSYRIDSRGGGYDDEGYQQAVRFCFDQGKQLLQLDSATADGRTASTMNGELRFRCVGPGEPGWKEPVG